MLSERSQSQRPHAIHLYGLSTTGQSIKTADQQYGVGREKNGNDANRYGKKIFPLGGGVITAWNVSYILMFFFLITFKTSCRVGTLGLTKNHSFSEEYSVKPHSGNLGFSKDSASTLH